MTDARASVAAYKVDAVQCSLPLRMVTLWSMPAAEAALAAGASADLRANSRSRRWEATLPPSRLR